MMWRRQKTDRFRQKSRKNGFLVYPNLHFWYCSQNPTTFRSWAVRYSSGCSIKDLKPTDIWQSPGHTWEEKPFCEVTLNKSLCWAPVATRISLKAPPDILLFLHANAAPTITFSLLAPHICLNYLWVCPSCQRRIRGSTQIPRSGIEKKNLLANSPSSSSSRDCSREKRD